MHVLNRMFLVALFGTQAAPLDVAQPLWTDVTKQAIGVTAEWTNKVGIADIDNDGRPDLLFANGGNYSQPGTPELNRAFINTGRGFTFQERSTQVFGSTPDLARVIKARDLNGDGLTDILVGTTYQTQSRLYLGAGGGAFREVTASHLPAVPLSVGDLEFADVDNDYDLDILVSCKRCGGSTLFSNDGKGTFAEDLRALPQYTNNYEFEPMDLDGEAFSI